MPGAERGAYFNSRPSARGDHSVSVSDACIYYFNSRPSARGDRIQPRLTLSSCYFNSRPSARGDGRCRIYQLLADYISIHAPPRGATTEYNTVTGLDLFQFTPLREGRLCRRAICRVHRLFQFTPLREGRRELVGGIQFITISIHAPPRGATALLRLSVGRGPHFNSRPSARGDDHRFDGLN